MNSKVDFYFDKTSTWQTALNKLRTIILETGLNEELKWRVPCYLYKNNNILLIHDFKDYCAILFTKGVLLNDTHSLLIQQTKNVQSGRQLRFTSLIEIIELETLIKNYVYEAIEIEKAGLKVEFKKTEEFEVPLEFTEKLTKMPELKIAFESLTQGRQKGYLLYFSEAKQAKTRATRIEKSIPLIMIGKGLNDCTCGLSKRMPNCDGSHKQLI